jgi:hypothetical protein
VVALRDRERLPSSASCPRLGSGQAPRTSPQHGLVLGASTGPGPICFSSKNLRKRGRGNTANHAAPKKIKIKKNRKRGRAYTRHTYKKRDILLCPFRVAVALSCVSGVVYLCRDTFFVDFSSATACYHCVHIASFLHDFDRFSYSLSIASC